MPRTYKIYRLSNIAGKIYLWYREKIWDYYRRALRERIYDPPEKPRTYHYFELPIPDGLTSLDLLALIWYAVYHNNIFFINSPSIDESRIYLHKLPRRRVSRGVNYFVNTIARTPWITKEQLLYLAYRSTEHVMDLPRSKSRVTFIEPGLKEIAVLERMKPLEALFAISALYIAKKREVDAGEKSDYGNPRDTGFR